MSTFTVAYDPLIDYYSAYPIVVAQVRAPDTYIPDQIAGIVTITFTPDLTSAELTTLQTLYADLKTMAHFGIDDNLSITEYQAMKADIATAKTYVGLASPTNAQTVAALKSTIRVLGALLRS